MNVAKLKQKLADLDDEVVVMYNHFGDLYFVVAIDEKETDFYENNGEDWDPDIDADNGKQYRGKVVMLR